LSRARDRYNDSPTPVLSRYPNHRYCGAYGYGW
jgi:hypothetical protein